LDLDNNLSATNKDHIQESSHGNVTFTKKWTSALMLLSYACMHTRNDTDKHILFSDPMNNLYEICLHLLAHMAKPVITVYHENGKLTEPNCNVFLICLLMYMFIWKMQAYKA
jgi:hypothetical protein